MNNYIKYAEREFVALGYDLNQKKEGPDEWIMEDIFELLEVFGKQGHSGYSAPYCVSVFKRLALFEPLAPLTGKDNEWNEVSNETWQNNRCSHVFKGKDGRAYDIHGKIFTDNDKNSYTNTDSHVFIEFPYTPKTEYVDVEKEGEETT